MDQAREVCVKELPAPVLDTAARISGMLVVFFLIVPLLVIIPISFNDGSFFTLPSQGLSLRWYRSVVTDPVWRLAAQNSLVVATLSTATSVVLGTAAGCGIAFLHARMAALAYAFMLVPMVTPIIVVALAVYLAFNAWGLTETRAGLVLAHAALGLPFVVVTTSAAMRKYDQRLFFAALSLGASYPHAFRHAVLPSLAPAILAGGIYAFQASFDESIIVLFLARAGQETLPQRIFAGLTDNITPAVAVVAVATTVASIILLIIFMMAERLQSRIARR
jgi:putative spermidine/putrescine transport system permease protein